MSEIALRLGALDVAGCDVFRSGPRWLCEDGHICRAGEAIAFCGLRISPLGGRRYVSAFADEARDLKVLFVSPVAGRVRYNGLPAFGGYLSFFSGLLWRAEDLVCKIVPTGEAPGGEADREVAKRVFAGRRVSDLAEDRSGLLTGWHDRDRAFSLQSEGAMGTLLALGVCDIEGVIKGESFAFNEFFDEIAGPAQIVFAPDRPLVPSVRVIAEQIERSEGDRAAILRDFGVGLSSGQILPGSKDWIFGGALMRALCASPITESYGVLTHSGLRYVEAPDAILLSLRSETSLMLRHRSLGYTISLHTYRLEQAGEAMLAWLRSSFAEVRRAAPGVHEDMRRLIGMLRGRFPNARILVNNLTSMPGTEDIHTYRHYAQPLGAQIASVRDKDLNLMLLDVARECDIDIVDAEGVAAELGGKFNIPDGVHPNRAMEDQLRSQILQILRARNVPGFQSIRLS